MGFLKDEFKFFVWKNRERISKDINGEEVQIEKSYL
jgi:hypothetical protein